MPPLTATTRIVLGIVSASAAILAGLIGNVLAGSIVVLVSGRKRTLPRRPLILWIVFFVSAALSVVAGSVATFAPVRAQPGSASTQTATLSPTQAATLAAGASLHLDGATIMLSPTNAVASWSNTQVQVSMHVWKTGPSTRRYENIKALDQFASISGESLPLNLNPKSTGAIDIDLALKFASALPQKITETHVLRFPDVRDVMTDSVECS